MTGGMAFLYDPDGETDLRLNPETVIAVPVESAAWAGMLRRLVERHHRETASPRAAEILRNWDEALPQLPPDRPEGDAEPPRPSAQRPRRGGDGLSRGDRPGPEPVPGRTCPAFGLRA